MVEYKLDSEGAPCEYKTPVRRNTTWHRVPTPALQPLPRAQVEGTQRPGSRASVFVPCVHTVDTAHFPMRN